jgi:hypothetical protein
MSFSQNDVGTLCRAQSSQREQETAADIAWFFLSGLQIFRNQKNKEGSGSISESEVQTDNLFPARFFVQNEPLTW